MRLALRWHWTRRAAARRGRRTPAATPTRSSATSSIPQGFSHFEWVNPDAPKGGDLSLVPPLRITNFDKCNPFTLKGTSPPGMGGLMFETLLTGTLDEPTTAYGLLAEDVEVAPDKLSVTFRLNPAARFHNGKPVMAADVKHSFDQADEQAGRAAISRRVSAK